LSIDAVFSKRMNSFGMPLVSAASCIRRRDFFDGAAFSSASIAVTS